MVKEQPIWLNLNYFKEAVKPGKKINVLQIQFYKKKV